MHSPAFPISRRALILSEILRRYEEGQDLDAFDLAKAELGHPAGWTAPCERILAGRLLGSLGARRQAALHFVQAYRHAPGSPEAVFYQSTHVLERQGPFATLSFLSKARVREPCSDEIKACLLLAQADCLSHLRDFEAANKLFLEARSLAPELPWLWAERAAQLDRQDEPDAALEAGHHALSLRPHYRPAVQITARLLLAEGRVDEALSLLNESAAHNQSGALHLQKALLLKEVGNHQTAWESFVEAAAHMPCAEPQLFRYLAGQCSDVAYHAGRVDLAIAFAKAADTPLMSKLAQRLESKLPSRRVEWPVPFVRQAHRTCGPATLTAISRFYGHAAEHVAVAEAICFDGTSAASERRWAEDNDFVTREFTVTWESAVAVLDSGWPFTLTTQETTSAHLQAVVGYDQRRRSLLVRDPAVPHLVEYDADSLFEQQAWAGPRGLAVVPREHGPRLHALTLPDSDLFDLAYKQQQALEAHDRAAAADRLAELQALAPQHEISAQAARALANYDGNQLAMLASYEAQLARHGQVARLQLGQIACLRGLGRREEMLAVLERLVKDGRPDPVFGQQLAFELQDDARNTERCQALLLRAISARYDNAEAYAILGSLFANQQRWQESRTCFRYAACLDEAHEGAAQAYFTSARNLGDAEAALAFLKRRFETRGLRYAAPAHTLFWALSALGRAGEGLLVLETALQQRPEDGDLALFAAQSFARLGRFNEARAQLEHAKPRTRNTDWLRAAAALDLAAGDLPAALQRFQSVVETQPLALDAQAEVVRLLTATQSPAAVLEHLKQVVQRYPHHAGLARLMVEFTKYEGEAGLQALQKLLALAPDDPEVHRDLALSLGKRARFEEALAALKQAQIRQPNAAATFCVEGYLQQWRQDRAAAEKAFKRAIELDVDDVQSIQGLMLLGDSSEKRTCLLSHVRNELLQQVDSRLGFGAGLLAYRELARAHEPADQTLSLIAEVHRRRPDLEAAWSALIDQLLVMERLEEASTYAETYRQRFAMQVDPYLKLAEVHRVRGEREALRAALLSAATVAPGEARAARLLGEAYGHDQMWDQAIHWLGRAVSAQPLDVSHVVALADALWEDQRTDAGLERIKAAINLDPSHAGAWERLSQWASTMGRRADATSFAERLAAEQPNNPWAHYGLAQCLDPSLFLDAHLAALEAAIALEPRLTEAHDARALALCSAGRHEEAQGACSPTVYQGALPLSLRGRAAWVEGMRGNPGKAITLLRSLLQEEADYTFALTLLGRCLVQVGDKQSAKEVWRKALALMPGNADVAWPLLQLEIEDEEEPAAARTLACLHRYETGTLIHLATIQVALLADREEDALAALWSMAKHRVQHLGQLDEAARRIRDAGFSQPLAAQIEQMWQDPRCAPEVGYLWVRYGHARSLVGWWALLHKLLPSPLGVQAAVAHVELLAAKPLGLALVSFLLRFRSRLRQDPTLWGTVGHALSHQGYTRGALAWLADWRNRQAVSPWMLLGLVIALRSLGKDTQAHNVSLAALNLPPDHAVEEHRMWLAWDAARQGDTKHAKQYLASAAPPDGPIASFVTRLLEAAIAAAEGAPPARIKALVLHARAAWPGSWRRRLARRLLAQLRKLNPAAR